MTTQFNHNTFHDAILLNTLASERASILGHGSSNDIIYLHYADNSYRSLSYSDYSELLHLAKVGLAVLKIVRNIN